jgi:hypothetical protein
MSKKLASFASSMIIGFMLAAMGLGVIALAKVVL